MSQNKNEVTRIYQGRITGVTALSGTPRQLSTEEAERILWEHHALYQDAVNYYIFCLASMANSKDSFIGKLWERIRDVWNDYRRHGELRPGLKHSLIRTLGHAEELLNDEHGMDVAREIVLNGNTTSKYILEKAVEQIADKCIINGDIKQQGATYIARICFKDSRCNFECDSKAINAADGMSRLFSALESSDAIANVKNIVADMAIDWCGIKSQTGAYFEGADAREELKKAVLFFLDRDKKIGKEAMELLDTDKARIDSVLRGYLDKVDSLGDIRYGRNTQGCVLNRRNIAWLLKFFPDELTVNLAKIIYEKQIKQTKNNIAVLPPDCPDDPVKMARGSRGYIFPPFTSLTFKPLENEKDPLKSKYKKFDKEAFVESLKTINQFNQKTDEREKELKVLREAFAWMNGESALNIPSHMDDNDSEEDSSVLPILKGDSRWNCLRRILAEDLRVDNPFTEGLLGEYGLTARAVRCASIVFREWEKVYKDIKAGIVPEGNAEQLLIECINKVQTDKPEVFGSAALFRELAKRENWCIWLSEWQEPGEYRSTNILEDAVRYSDIAEQIERLSAPINFTPADPVFSRRQLDLKPFTGEQMGHVGQCQYAVYLSETPNGQRVFSPFRLEYSAPRLCRDRLQSTEGSIYYPPAVQALLEKEQADSVNFADVDVQLMLDFDRKGKIRYLLNFLPALNTTKILSKTASAFQDGQLWPKNVKVNICLFWPTYNGAAKDVNWYKDARPFDIVAVDLGQRTAGALSRITVTTVASPNSVPIGNDGTREWYACRRHAELLRLPGEGCTVLNGGSREQEPYGKHGRIATQQETEQALNIASLLSADGKPAIMFDGNDKVRFFPEQNDRLLIALRRATGRLRQLARFHYALVQGNVTDKIRDELDNCSWLQSKSLDEIKRMEGEYRTLLPQALLDIADRILPLRGRKWCWDIDAKTGCRLLKQTEKGTADAHKWIRGQRGLSFQRIEQLEELRIRCQAVNRILMDEPGAKPKSIREMRETPIPDPCPDILMRLDEMKEQRVNQTANMILMQALGLRHKPHVLDGKSRKEADIHGEYEKIPGLEPVAFIAIENLSRYRFSQDRSRHENSRLMKWAHRAVRDKLVLLCEVFGLPVVEVNAAYSSKFSADGIPGFRAEELTPEAIRRSFAWSNMLEKTDSAEARVLSECLKVADELHGILPNSTVLMPRNGGPVFVCFCKDDRLVQADINASFNIGIRAVAEGSRLSINNRLSMERGGTTSDQWLVRKTSKLSKAIYKGDYSIEYAPYSELRNGGGGTFFVLGCPSDGFLRPYEQKPVFKNPELRTKYPNLMFGSGVWHDLLRQLRRCLELNRKRLELARIRKDAMQNG